MVWHETTDVEQFLAAAGDLLLGDPALHTVPLTVCENVRARDDGTVFAWWQEADLEVTGCVSRTPPYPLLVGVLPEEAMLPLLDLWQVDGVNGSTAVAAQLAALAAQRYGTVARLRRAERLYQLGELVTPDTPGRARLADEGDLDLLVEWFDAFVAESGLPPHDGAAIVRDRLSHDGLLVWEADGPVAFAGQTRKAFQGMRIGPVYTPPEHRGRGYGGAVTAAAAARARELGAWEVVLFTDLTNPVSNGLYRRLGFVARDERAVFELDRIS